ncbi:MAG: radical SAM protein [Candidatus Aenigmatarchaeota archaeon]
MPKNVYIETYGCAANQNDTEILTARLMHDDARIVEDIEMADEIIINSCAVKQPTENKIMYRIKEIHEKYPEKKIIIAGCLAKTNRIPGFCEKLDTTNVEKVNTTMIRKNNDVDMIQISRGCLGECAYCATRLARGHLKSSPPEDIINRVKKSLSEGVEQFRFTSQDCGCYGYDLEPKMNLANLINKVLETLESNDVSIRIGMINPIHLKEFYHELIECYKDPHMIKFLHIPVQSGSDDILQAMGRPYKISEFEEIVQEFRREIPNIIIWTDIIVGFPGESDSDFEKSCKLIQDIRPDFVNISKFGVRPDTTAADMEQLPSQVIKERSIKMSEIVRHIRNLNKL